MTILGMLSDEVKERLQRAAELQAGAEAQAAEFLAQREFYKTIAERQLETIRQLGARIEQLEPLTADLTKTRKENETLKDIAIAYLTSTDFIFNRNEAPPSLVAARIKTQELLKPKSV